MPASQVKTKVETKKFYYFNPIDCITKMMNQNSMKDWEWDYNQNGGNIEHPSNAKGWKEYEKLKMKLEAVNQDKKYKLLCPMMNIDEFQSQKYRKKKVYGIKERGYLQSASNKVRIQTTIKLFVARVYKECTWKTETNYPSFKKRVKKIFITKI